MAKDNFAACIAEVRRHEGGFVHHPADPGGATNMGITRATLADWRGRAVSVQEVRDLPWDEAQRIYHARYWLPVRAEDLPRGVDLAVLDAAVNSGPGRAVRWLQQALGVAQDGRIGPETLQAAANIPPDQLLRRITHCRMGFLRGLRHWSSFGRGWTRRVAAVEAAGLAMAVSGDAQALTRAAGQAAKAAGQGRIGSVAGGAAAGLVLFGLEVPWPLQAAGAALAVLAAAVSLRRAGRSSALAQALIARATGGVANG